MSIENPKAIEAKESLVKTVTEMGAGRDVLYLYIEYVLARFGGNKVHAAKALGINRRTIQRLIRVGRVRGVLHYSAPPQAGKVVRFEGYEVVTAVE